MIVETRKDSAGYMEQVMSVGSALANSGKVLLREGRDQNGRVTPGYKMSDAMVGLDKVNPFTRASTAIMLENTRQFFGNMSESTRLMNIGDFDKYAFQMVRAVFPNLIAHQIVSVQPMMGPTQMVFYMQYLYNKTKGKAKAGTDIHENPNSDYTSEHVDEELVGASGVARVQATLDYHPIRPGTVTITDGAQVMTDDGQGKIIGDVDAGGTNTVNYQTGALDATFAAVAGADASATYDYNMEANDNLPELDLNLSSASVTARTRKLRTKWSLESVQDMKALYGNEVEVELVGACANELKFEIDREITKDLINFASASASPVQWGKDLPTGISYTEHKLSLVDSFTFASNAIFKKTQRATGTFLVAGTNVCNILETLPGWKGDGVLTGRGVYRAGTLNNRWVVFKDSYMDDNKWLMGYKGEAMFETGYIWAPYIPMYTTPTVMLDDFVGRRGIASRYGKKHVNSRFFVNGEIVAGKTGPQPVVY